MNWLTPKRIAGALATLLCVAVPLVSTGCHQRTHLQLLEQASQLPADGRLYRIVRFAPMGAEATAFVINTSGLPSQLTRNKRGGVELTVQSPVLPGDRAVHVSYGGSAAILHLSFLPSTSDSVGDGTPDFLRLHTAEDRSAFRSWFTAMADAAADMPDGELPREIDDCAALLRWCYRNAIHAHDETWLQSAPVGVDLTRPSVRQYSYPLTPLGAALFRVHEGAFILGDERNGAFAQFADARTLWERNTFFLSRDVRSARPGDLLFFRQLEQNSPYHSMIVTGRAQQTVIYHTGPIGRGPGEMRRVLLQDLLDHPDPRWRPTAGNSNFLGVYRWNILREDPR